MIISVEPCSYHSNLIHSNFYFKLSGDSIEIEYSSFQQLKIQAIFLNVVFHEVLKPDLLYFVIFFHTYPMPLSRPHEVYISLAISIKIYSATWIVLLLFAQL